MATVLCLAALCWLMGPAVQGTFYQSRRSEEDPGTWNTSVVPRKGTYVVSATVDPRYARRQVSSIEVKANGQRVFKIFAFRTTNSGAMAVRLRRGSTITAEVSGNPPSVARNSLTVCLLDKSKFFGSLRLGVSARHFNYGSNVTFLSRWLSFGWTQTRSGPCQFYRIRRSGIYWVMAQSYPMGSYQPVDIRYMRYSCRGWFSLFVVWTDQYKPASCAGAYQLTVGGRVYMTGRHSHVWLHSSTMLSLVELRARGPERSKMAFTTRPLLNFRADCSGGIGRGDNHHKRWARDHDGWDLDKGQDNRGHHTTKGEDPSHRTATSSVRAARSDAGLGTVLYWFGPVLTNYGSMAFRGGHTVTIRSTGTYLLSMRPDPLSIGQLNFAVVKNGHTVVWRVYTDETPVGDMAAFRFTANTTLEYVIFQSNACHFQDGSYISIALCQSDLEG